MSELIKGTKLEKVIRKLSDNNFVIFLVIVISTATVLLPFFVLFSKDSPPKLSPGTKDIEVNHITESNTPIQNGNYNTQNNVFTTQEKIRPKSSKSPQKDEVLIQNNTINGDVNFVKNGNITNNNH